MSTKITTSSRWSEPPSDACFFNSRSSVDSTSGAGARPPASTWVTSRSYCRAAATARRSDIVERDGKEHEGEPDPGLAEAPDIAGHADQPEAENGYRVDEHFGDLGGLGVRADDGGRPMPDCLSAGNGVDAIERHTAETDDCAQDVQQQNDPIRAIGDTGKDGHKGRQRSWRMPLRYDREAARIVPHLLRRQGFPCRYKTTCSTCRWTITCSSHPTCGRHGCRRACARTAPSSSSAPSR